MFLLALVCVNSSLVMLMRYDASQTRTVKDDVRLPRHKQSIYNLRIDEPFVIPDYFDAQPLVYDHDPRLTNAVYMQHLLDHPDEELAFSWYDWVDLTDLNGMIRLHPDDKPLCDYVCGRIINRLRATQLQEMIDLTYIEEAEELMDAEAKPDGQDDGTSIRKKTPKTLSRLSASKCSRYCRSDNSRAQPGFRIFDLGNRAKGNVKSLHSKSYLYSEAAAPVSLVFITPTGNRQFFVQSNEGDNKQEYNMVNNGLLPQFISRHGRTFDPVSIALDFYGNDTRKEMAPELELEHDDFVFDAPTYIKTHKPKMRSEHLFQDSLNNSIYTRDEALKKYFNEAAISSEPAINGAHYDARFFNGGQYTNLERQTVLSRMLMSWVQLCQNVGLHTWIAHGALLSHSYNGLSFPWDDDIDVQIPYRDLMKLAELYNSSVIVEDATKGFGRHYLDVSNSPTHRTLGNGLNRIDARFIDMSSGMFIDITAVAVSPTIIPRRYEQQYNELENTQVEHWDPNVVTEDYYKSLSPQEEIQLGTGDRAFRQRVVELRKQRGKKPKGLTQGKSMEEMYDINYKLQMYNCRNLHVAQLQELSPLKLTVHDGSLMYVPNDIDKILLSEYKEQPKLSMDHRDHTYVPQLRIWVTTKSLQALVSKGVINMTESDIVSLLRDEEILAMFQKTWELTLNHELGVIKEDPLWMDPFIQRFRDPGPAELNRKAMEQQLKDEYDGCKVRSKELVKEYQRSGIDPDAELQRAIDDELTRRAKLAAKETKEKGLE